MLTIFDYFERILESPENIAEDGVPQNTLYEFVPHTYLNGFINHTETFYVVMLERYAQLTPERIEEAKALARLTHTNYRDPAFDDIVILSETEHSYWFFWSDRSVTDCYIGRFDKRGIEKVHVIAAIHRYLQQCSESSEIDLTGRSVELPLPDGWVGF